MHQIRYARPIVVSHDAKGAPGHLSNGGSAAISIRLGMVWPIPNEELPARDTTIHSGLCTAPHVEQAHLAAPHRHLQVKEP